MDLSFSRNFSFNETVQLEFKKIANEYRNNDKLKNYSNDHISFLNETSMICSLDGTTGGD
jgi:hypothetical protein